MNFMLGRNYCSFKKKHVKTYWLGTMTGTNNDCLPTRKRHHQHFAIFFFFFCMHLPLRLPLSFSFTLSSLSLLQKPKTKTNHIINRYTISETCMHVRTKHINKEINLWIPCWRSRGQFLRLSPYHHPGISRK